TLALTSLSGGTVNLTLQGPGGVTYALGAVGASNVSKLITDFAAPVAGTYYAVVNGTAGTTYSLVVTRYAGFDTEPNDTIAAARSVLSAQVAGEQRVLGHVIGGGSDLFSLRGTPVTGGLVLAGSKITLGINADGSFITAAGGT